MRYLTAALLGLLLYAAPVNALRENVTPTGVNEVCFDEGEMGGQAERYKALMLERNRLALELRALEREMRKLRASMAI